MFHAFAGKRIKQDATPKTQRGDLDAALAYSTESLELRRQIFGSDSVMIASGLVTHANIFEARREFDRAEPLFRRAYKVGDQGDSILNS